MHHRHRVFPSPDFRTARTLVASARKAQRCQLHWQEMGPAAAICVGHRLNLMGQGMVDPSKTDMPEMYRMVAEKWAAAAETLWIGYLAMWQGFWRITAETAAVSTAAALGGLAPWRQRVTANARRLGRSRK
ncbi:hypothetical protein [Telmatospirillum sp. J64-1]|uniref:hypothetical protein n=1 Tax=Telmatospirillum sp. J64-1 TaxID=2502183 RepID=UPI00163D6D2D|nr:hypothetical protein [Telmatospirillum sp. J64-1]